MPDNRNSFSEDDGIKIHMGIQDGGIAVPEGSEPAVGTWICPCGYFSSGPWTSSTACLANVVVQCPYCERTAEIVPEVVDELG